jgi:hypothetical protein
MSKHDEKKSHEKADAVAKEENAKSHAAHRDVQAAAHVSGDPHATTPPADPDVRMSPVNPRKPLDKEPAYAPGVGPNIAAGNDGSSPPTDPRVPPENVSAISGAPGSSTEPAPGQATAEPVKAAPEPVITPAQAGLAQPHLRAGLDPLPEEDPTPSTVPIPPPGPRRVA